MNQIIDILINTSFNINSKEVKNSFDINSIIQNCNSIKKNGKVNLAPLGSFYFPYTELGSIKSTDFFNLNEIVMFAYYWRFKDRYEKTADMGSCLGLHSLVMEKCGFDVDCYEPDPETFKKLIFNLKKNNLKVNPINSAISDFNGKSNFTRLNNNSTGSHISGMKKRVYGSIEELEIEVINLDSVVNQYDLIKLDIEGSEGLAFDSLTKNIKTDFFIEIHNETNSKKIFDKSVQLGLNIFSQKIEWGKVVNFNMMPLNYREGGVFITKRDSMFD